jgi:hypothetical protein
MTVHATNRFGAIRVGVGSTTGLSGAIAILIGIGLL